MKCDACFFVPKQAEFILLLFCHYKFGLNVMPDFKLKTSFCYPPKRVPSFEPSYPDIE